MASKARLGFKLGRVLTSRNIITSHRVSRRASDHSRENCGRNGMRTQVLVPKNGIKIPSNCSFRGSTVMCGGKGTAVVYITIRTGSPAVLDEGKGTRTWETKGTRGGI